ncbi:hypothetical protein GCM10027214_37660 [Stenotrophomonas tumulicola]
MLRVLHDPVAYYRPWQGRVDRLAPTQRGALNRWLAERHGLPAYTAPTPPQHGMVERLLADWSRLPRVAYLLACAKQRRRLMGSRLFLAQAPQVHGFLRLGFAESRDGIDISRHEDLLAWGGSYLCGGLQGRVPDWMAVRAALWFDGLPGHAAPSQPAATFDLTCFWSAWHHAAQLSRNAA